MPNWSVRSVELSKFVRIGLKRDTVFGIVANIFELPQYESALLRCMCTIDSASEARVRKEAKGRYKIRQNKEEPEDFDNERGKGHSFREGQI